MANPFYLSDIRRLEASKRALTGRDPSPELYDRLFQNELAMRYQSDVSKNALATETNLRQQGLDIQKEQMNNQKSAAMGNLVTTAPLYLMGAYKLGKDAGVGDYATKGYDYVKGLFNKPGETALPETTGQTSPALTGYESMEQSMEAANAAPAALSASALNLAGPGAYGAGAGGAAMTGAGAGGAGVYGAGAGYEAALGMSSGAGTATGAGTSAAFGSTAGSMVPVVGWSAAAGSIAGKAVPTYITHEKPTAGRGGLYGAAAGAAAGAAYGASATSWSGPGAIVGGVVGAVVGGISGAISGSK
jgi:hypothetical protein